MNAVATQAERQGRYGPLTRLREALEARNVACREETLARMIRNESVSFRWLAGVLTSPTHLRTTETWRDKTVRAHQGYGDNRPSKFSEEFEVEPMDREAAAALLTDCEQEARVRLRA